MKRTARHALARTILALVLAFTPLWGDHWSVSAFPFAIGALLAYDGTSGRMVFWTAAYLIAVESVWGIPVGVLSLAYAAAVLVVRGGHRFVAWVPLSRQTGWSVVSLGRTILGAQALALVMVVGSLGVQALWYGQGRWSSLATFWYHVPWGGFIIAAVLVVLLKRIDAPFRRRIMFGT